MDGITDSMDMGLPGREAALAWASLAQRFPASSVLARERAGCGSVGVLLEEAGGRRRWRDGWWGPGLRRDTGEGQGASLMAPGKSGLHARGEGDQGLVPLRWGCALPSPNAPGKAPNHIHTTLRKDLQIQQ